MVYFYDEEMQHQHVAATHLNHVAAGRLMRREADRLHRARRVVFGQESLSTARMFEHTRRAF